MAKISRRAVASSSSPSSSSSSSSSSTASLSAATSAAASASSSTSAYSTSKSSSTTNANRIAYAGKPARRATAEALLSSKFLEQGIYSGVAATVLPDPLRSNAYATATTTGSNEQNLYTADPTLIDNASAASPAPTFMPNKTAQAQIIEDEKARIRREFFETYDVMTGVRIAATLSGFFGLMVFLIVWKSRSSSNETMKVLKDPKMAAVAAVCMQEEEEREIQEAMVATGMSIYPDEYDAIAYRRQRMLSLGNVSAPPMLNRGFRFSSVGGGGYSSLLEPPRRFSLSATSAGGGSLGGSRRKSGSESSRILCNYPMGSSFGNDDYFMETEDEMDSSGEYPQVGTHLEDHSERHKRADSTRSKRGFLEVPLMGQDSRRSSAMTCCSTESSYLERRCSAFTLGLSNLPPTLQRKLSTVSRTSSTDNWDYYYPDIQVIQPTPKPSPCPSERSIYEQLQSTTAAFLQTTTTGAGTKTTIATTTTSKTAKPNTAANMSLGMVADAPTFVRKHSIAYYDPESAQSGRKQEIHSISADTVDMFPYNQVLTEYVGLGFSGGNALTHQKTVQSAPPTSGHQGFHFTDSPLEELRLNVQRKIAEQMTPPATSTGGYENNNTFPYTNSAAAIANSSSISIDSTPLSIDKLNGSGSLGTISAKALFNVEKRAPLASLSSFKISSLEYQDSEMRSLDEDSVFLDSVADTDEDMQQMSSDSEEVSVDAPNVGVTTTQAVAEQEPLTVASRLGQPLRYPIEKRLSLGAPPSNSGGGGGGTVMMAAGSTNRARARPLLQRHRTISVSSSERVALIGQQLKEFQGGSGTQTPNTNSAQPLPLETHFGSIICTNSSPPTHPRRAQLLQQYSDPQSLPTNTTTEDDTCSTLNTEVCAGTGGDSSTGAGSGTRDGSTTHTQHSSLNTVISFGRTSSPLADSSSLAATASTETPQNQPQHQQLQQLPRSRLADDPCASSISDSVISTRHPIICMPSSLKNLILRGSGTGAERLAASGAPTTRTVSKSATNLSFLETDVGAAGGTTSTSVMLELPLIKLPTDESSESSSASDDIATHCRSKSDDSQDPSLPGTSRKWSKETLF